MTRGWTKAKELDHSTEVWALAFSKDGQYMATGAADGARVFETSSWREIRHGFPYDSIGSVAFSPDGQLLAIAGVGNTALVINGKTGREAWRVRHAGPVRSVAFSPDGRYLATGRRP